MRSLLVASTVLLALFAVGATAQDCPVSGITPQTWIQNQDYVGRLNKYQWYLSPCSAGAPKRLGEKSCADKGSSTGFFGEWGIQGGACMRLMNKQIQEWTNFTTGETSGFTATFEDPSGSQSVITILCDATAGNLEPTGNVVATPLGGSPGTYTYTWNVTLKSNAVCGRKTPAPTSTPSGCSQYLTCDSCTNSPSGTCGFCTGSKTCMAGTSSGPSGGQVCSHDWNWYFAQCGQATRQE